MKHFLLVTLLLLRPPAHQKPWAPIPSHALKGQDEIELPLMFKDERGYLELEQRGQIELEEGKVIFIKRVNQGPLKNAYEVQVLPKNGKSKIDVIYHPALPSAGWAKITVTFVSSLPVLNGYKVVMEIEKKGALHRPRFATFKARNPSLVYNLP
jgi:hypothetical protein